MSSASTRPRCAAGRPGGRGMCCRRRPRTPPPTTWAGGTWTPSPEWPCTTATANYFHPRWENLAGHQACAAHLLRDFADAAETYPDQHWPAQAQRALRGLVRAWHTARDAGLAQIGHQVRDELAAEFRRAVRVGLSQVPRVPGPRRCTAQHPGRELLEFCRDREDDVLRFCLDTRIWPTNNISERDLRPTKTQQKISGRLTSEQVTQHRLDIRSYIDTARKQGIDVMTALRQAITGNPWRPPRLAPT